MVEDIQSGTSGYEQEQAVEISIHDATEVVSGLSPRHLEILDGAVDLHIHPGPSIFERSVDVRLAYEHAVATGMLAIGLKSHFHSMATDVKAALPPESLRRVKTLTGVTLGNFTGGMNPYAVELMFALGGEIVWFPTLSSKAHMENSAHVKFPQSKHVLRTPTEVSVLDNDGNVLPEVKDILQIIQDNQGILCLGHEDAKTVEVILAHTKSNFNIERILILHPNYIVGATPQIAAHWAHEYGAVIEHSACMYASSSDLKSYGIEELSRYISAVGPDHSALGSDLGQASNPPPVTGFAEVAIDLIEAGHDEAVVRALTSTTASRLAQL